MSSISDAVKLFVYQKKIKQLISQYPYLHIGCGNLIVSKWINIDSLVNPHLKKEEINNLKNSKYFLKHDVIKRWIFPNCSIKQVYCSHFIEHLKKEDAGKFVSNIYFSLEKGGIFRISTPDLHVWTTNYLAKNHHFFRDFYKNWQSFPNLQTITDIYVGQFYGWDHKWMYDENSLKNVLLKAGFNKIMKTTFRRSKISDIHLMETNERRIESLYMEAVK